MRKNLLFTASTLAALAFAGGAQAEKELVICTEAYPVTFSPINLAASTDIAIMSKVAGGLLDFLPGTSALEENIAENYVISGDGQRVIFTLRDDVWFHSNAHFTPTRPMNADDVVFTFNRLIDTENEFHNIAEQAFAAAAAKDLSDLVSAVRKVDNYSVEFTLKRPDFRVLAKLATVDMSIYSHEYAEAMKAAGTLSYIEDFPIGTGPFQIDKVVEGERVELVAFDKVWSGRPKLDRVIFLTVSDSEERYKQLHSGNCDISILPPPSVYGKMFSHPDLNVVSFIGNNTAYMAYNTLEPPFDNPEVRRALNMAVNRDRLIEEVYHGYAERAKSILPPTMFGHNFDLEDEPYDPEAARKILRENGIESLDTQLWSMPVQRLYNPNSELMARLIAEDWAKVGVNAEIVSTNWPDYIEMAGNENRKGPLLMGWSSTVDPDNMLQILKCDAIGRLNFANWCNEELETLFHRASESEDATEMLEIYAQMQEIFKSDAPWMTIAHSMEHIPMQKHVIYPAAGTLGEMNFSEIDIVE